MKSNIDKVMIIDDTEIDLYITSSLMEACKFANSIITRTSAEEVVTYLKVNADNPAQLPDIIFLDIRMPVMDGFGFLDEYDKLSESVKNHCFIYMLSSSLDDEDHEKTRSNPYVVSFINKPLYPENLANIKNQILASHINSNL